MSVLSPQVARDFYLAGAATFTVENPTTGRRFTFRVQQSEPGFPHFVRVLNGPDNTTDYAYLGTLFEDGFVVTRKSQFTASSPAARAFTWLHARLSAGADLGPVIFRHEGRCGACGRPLTVPESIDTGLGPVCALKRGHP